MLLMETVMEIRILRRQGKSIREIARMTGKSRNTVKRYLHSDGPPVYKARPARGSKLDPFKGWLIARVQAAPPTGSRRRCCSANCARKAIPAD